ncbi:MAG: hypothetical protein V3S60_07675 [Acidimicrobiia bacterium]
MPERKFVHSLRSISDDFTEWTEARWYVKGLLFPALVTSILLGVLAAAGSWWLWPVALLIAVPALLVVVPSAREAFATTKPGWHLR